jgi:hypothetical protein
MRHADYFDIRSSFWRSCFEKALDYERYLSLVSTAHSKRWRERDEAIPQLTKEQGRRLTGHRRKLNVLVVSGTWCGDCIRQVPMIRLIAETCGDGVTMRVIERDAEPRLRDELRIMGAMRVPVAVFLTEDFFEIARYGDQTLTNYRRKVAVECGDERWISSPPEDESASELAEWVDGFERALLMARTSPFLRRRYGD